MRRVFKFSFIALVYGWFTACAPVKFEATPEPSCASGDLACVKTCTDDSCVQTYSVTRTVGRTPVDILLVDDNSGSMSAVQNLFASAFSGFLQNLEGAGLDYRIALTTTDVSNKYSQMDGADLISRSNGPSPFNGSGALQDGNLIDLGSGKKFITPEDSDRLALFEKAVKREETLHCEESGYKECPSSDERGIFAMNLVLDRTADQFIRPGSAVAVIVLSNEDERGMSNLNPSTAPADMKLKQAYPQKRYDLPQTFVDRFRAKYPDKTLSVHSIIVKPGDQQCLRNSLWKTDQFIFVKPGYAYAKLSEMTGGEVQSICNPNYVEHLQKIGNNIQAQAMTLPFSCRPDGDLYQVTVTPERPVNWAADWNTMQLTTNDVLPVGTSVTLSYSCTKAP